MLTSTVSNHRQQIFIHGSARFKEDEWAGFEETAKEAGTKVVGIRIRRVYGGLRLFTRRYRSHHAMRGFNPFG